MMRFFVSAEARWRPSGIVAASVGVASAISLNAPPAQAFDFTRTLRAQYDSAMVDRGRELGAERISLDAALALGDFFGRAGYRRSEDLDTVAGLDPALDQLEFELSWSTLLRPRLTLDLGVFAQSTDVDEDIALVGDERREVYARVSWRGVLNPALTVSVDPGEELTIVEAGVYHRGPLAGPLDVRFTTDVGHVHSGDETLYENYAYASARADLVWDFLAGREAFVGVRAAHAPTVKGYLDPQVHEPDVLRRNRGDDSLIWLGGGVSWRF